MHGRERIRIAVLIFLGVPALAAALGLLLLPARQVQPAGDLSPAGPPQPVVAAMDLTEAERAMEAGDLEGCRRALESVNWKESPLGWELAGRLAESNGDIRMAVSCYQKGLALGPTANLHLRLALVFLRGGDSPKALPHLETGCALDPSHALLSNLRLLTLLDVGRKNEVEQEVSAWSAIGGDSAPWVFALAAVFFEHGDFQQGAGLLRLGRSTVDAATFDLLLNHPALARHANMPEVLAEILSLPPEPASPARGIAAPPGY
jgi:tetratricopeptide (TPR) repeat protein